MWKEGKQNWKELQAYSLSEMRMGGNKDDCHFRRTHSHLPALQTAASYFISSAPIAVSERQAQLYLPDRDYCENLTEIKHWAWPLACNNNQHLLTYTVTRCFTCTYLDLAINFRGRKSYHLPTAEETEAQRGSHAQGSTPDHGQRWDLNQAHRLRRLGAYCELNCL